MNLVIVHPHEVNPLGVATLTGPRAVHIQHVLRAGPGDDIRAGLLNGPKGTARILRVREGEVDLECRFASDPPARPRIDLLLALPRPKVMKRLWAQLAALGVGRVWITNAERVERNYFDSHVLDPAFYTPLLIEGLQQAQDTLLPRIEIHRRLKPLLEDQLSAADTKISKIVLHPGEGMPLIRVPAAERALLAVGPEGGWTAFEIDLFEKAGFRPATLGPRTLRSDTACIAALAIAHAVFDF